MSAHFRKDPPRDRKPRVRGKIIEVVQTRYPDGRLHSRVHTRDGSFRGLYEGPSKSPAMQALWAEAKKQGIPIDTPIQSTPVGARRDPGARAVPSRSPKMLNVSSEHSARLLHAGTSSQGWPLEVWVIQTKPARRGEVGTPVDQTELTTYGKAGGTWHAWTGNAVRSAQRALRKKLASARNRWRS